jgi:hypothetical protein
LLQLVLGCTELLLRLRTLLPGHFQGFVRVGQILARARQGLLPALHHLLQARSFLLLRRRGFLQLGCCSPLLCQRRFRVLELFLGHGGTRCRLLQLVLGCAELLLRLRALLPGHFQRFVRTVERLLQARQGFLLRRARLMRFLEGRLLLLEFCFDTLETLSCLGGCDGGLLGLLA